MHSSVKCASVAFISVLFAYFSHIPITSCPKTPVNANHEIFFASSVVGCLHSFYLGITVIKIFIMNFLIISTGYFKNQIVTSTTICSYVFAVSRPIQMCYKT